MSAYILQSEYPTWGLAAGAATDVLVLKASSLINAYCQRKSLGVATYSERLFFPESRNIVRLAYLPFVAWDTTDPNNTTGVKARYGLGRQGDSGAFYEATTLLQISGVFGGPPAWVQVATAQVDVFAATGEVWVPAGALAAHYTETELNYQAGYAVIPDPVKLAVTLIAQAVQNRMPNAKMIKAGDRAFEFFGPEMLDADIKRMLEPYRAKALR